MGGSITAGDALAGAGIDVAEVRLDLPSVEPFAVPVRSASPLFQRFWMSGVTAIATPWAIYMRPAAFSRIETGAEPARNGALVVHELTHIEQFHRLGALRHVVQYAGDYLRGRRRGLKHWEAYRQIRLEVEARTVAARYSESVGPR